MAPYHVVLVHFPIALWMVATLAIVIRAFNDDTLGQAMNRALPVLLVLGVIIGLIAYLVGLTVWPWESLSSTPMGRNHMLTATWSLAYFALLSVIRLRHGEHIWHGVSRWIMVILAGIGVALVGITGTLGGHLVGNYTAVGDVLRVLGWEIYMTYYVPNITLLVIAAVSIVLAAMAFLGRNRSTA